MATDEGGFSRSEFAERLGLNCSTAEQWERGVCRPSNENMVKLRHLIGDG